MKTDYGHGSHFLSTPSASRSSTPEYKVGPMEDNKDFFFTLHIL